MDSGKTGVSDSVWVVRYGDSVDNTVEENSCVLSGIRMHWLPLAGACWQ